MKRGLLRCAYTVKGVKMKDLPIYLHQKNVAIYGYKQKQENIFIVTIDYQDRRKFFAISKNMCYNILKVNYRGLLSPVYTTLKYIGVSIGVLLFTINCFTLNDFVYDVDCTGSGSLYKNEIISIAKDYGIYKGAKYSKANVDLLRLKLLSHKERLSFVSIEKRGNTVIINSMVSNTELGTLEKNVQPITCTIDGVVESAIVLSGTLLVNVGDKVKGGTVLIGAYTVGKDEVEYPTYVVGRVTVIEEKVKFFKSNKFDDDTIKNFISIAKFLQDNEVVSCTTKTDANGVYVILNVRHVFQ